MWSNRPATRRSCTPHCVASWSAFSCCWTAVATRPFATRWTSATRLRWNWRGAWRWREVGSRRCSTPAPAHAIVARAVSVWIWWVFFRYEAHQVPWCFSDLWRPWRAQTSSNRLSIYLNLLNQNGASWLVPGDTARLQELLSDDPTKANFVRNLDGCTPLMVASMVGSIVMVQFLRNQGAELNRTESRQGWTALMLACFYRFAYLGCTGVCFKHAYNVNLNRRDEVATYLVSEGADYSIKSRDGLTALDLTIISGEWK